MVQRSLLRAVEKLRGHRVLVVGDLMLDRYIFGAVRRISPEAPVPVVEITHEKEVLGGAANVAANIASLGGEVTVLGLRGADPAGKAMVARLEERGIDPGGVVVGRGRPTTLKTRVIGGHQQVVRVDRETREAPGPALARRIRKRVEELAADADAILVSDYGKGVIQVELLDAIRALRDRTGIPVIADPKDIHFSNYRRFSMVTPNENEASMAAGCSLRTDAQVEEAGARLVGELDLEHLLITRGAAGMSLFGRAGGSAHIHTVAREVFDVSGAGDTVVAVMALGLAAGIGAEPAAHLANAAAAEVVSHVGTAVIEREGLLRNLERIEGPAAAPARKKKKV